MHLRGRARATRHQQRTTAQTKADIYQHIFEETSDGLVISDPTTGLVITANPAACAMHGYSREQLIGLPLTDLMHPDSQPLFPTYVQAALAGEKFTVRALHLRHGGRSFPVEVSGSGLGDDEHRSLLVSICDVSEQVQTEWLLQQQMEARLHEQATLLKISQTLALALELKPALILDQLRMLIDYTQAGLFLLEGRTLKALAVSGPPHLEAALPFRLWMDGSRGGTVLLQRHRSVRIPDLHRPDSGGEMLRLLLGSQATLLLEGMRAWMWVPLVVQGRVIGGMSLAHAEPGAFTAHHAALALTMANQVAITLLNAQLYEHARALAALQERQRLAQDLHDAINQSLFSAGLIAEILPRLWKRNPLEGQQALEDVRLLIRSAQAELRGLLAELRPVLLLDTELGDLLRQLASALTGRTNIPVTVTEAWKGPLPADVHVSFYRLCQEALNNIVKHANASKVTIHLYEEGGSVALDIRDDGRGFDPDKIPSGHFGLGIMRERASQVGVALAITSQSGNGTMISVRWTPTPAGEAS